MSECHYVACAITALVVKNTDADKAYVGAYCPKLTEILFPDLFFDSIFQSWGGGETLKEEGREREASMVSTD